MTLFRQLRHEPATGWFTAMRFVTTLWTWRGIEDYLAVARRWGCSGGLILMGDWCGEIRRHRNADISRTAPRNHQTPVGFRPILSMCGCKTVAFKRWVSRSIPFTFFTKRAITAYHPLSLIRPISVKRRSALSSRNNKRCSARLT